MSDKPLANGGVIKAQPVPALMSSACDTVSPSVYAALVIMADKIKRGEKTT